MSSLKLAIRSFFIVYDVAGPKLGQAEESCDSHPDRSGHQHKPRQAEILYSCVPVLAARELRSDLKSSGA